MKVYNISTVFILAQCFGLLRANKNARRSFSHCVTSRDQFSASLNFLVSGALVYSRVALSASFS